MLQTTRLDLVPATATTLQAALLGGGALGDALGAIVPETWPPPLLDSDALEWTLRHQLDGSHQPRWSLYWILLREGDGQRRGDPRVVIGTSGYKGNPSADGTVEIGYGIVTDRHRRGYATETARALVDHAFESPLVNRVIAETLPDLVPSIGVLAKCGFAFIGDGSEPGVIRYELRRRTDG